MNHLLYRLKYRYGRYLNLKKPVDISLELSSICNMSCKYCYHSDDSKVDFKHGIMKYPVAADILIQASELRVNSVKFNWRGESTINPNFSKILKLAKSLSTKSTFIDRISNTNFLFTPHKEIFEGLACQTKVKVSLDSFNPTVFEEQRPGGDLNNILENIDTFYNYYKGINTELVIQAIRTTKNKNEDIEGIIAKRWPLAKASVRDVVEGRNGNEIDDLKVKEMPKKRQACLQAFNRLIFDFEGNATCCCPDIKQRIFLGNIYDKTIYEMFNSVQMQQLRNNLKTGFAFKHSPCKTCSSFESYAGYHAPWRS